MIPRNWKLVGSYGYRITHLAEIDPVETDRMINVRFDHLYNCNQLLWAGYQSIT